jgi:hypothetical protein
MGSPSPRSASLFITIRAFPCYGYISRLVNSIPHTADSTEVAIQRMIEGVQRMIRVNNKSQEEGPINQVSRFLGKKLKIIIHSRNYYLKKKILRNW